jgi:cytochrome c553
MKNLTDEQRLVLFDDLLNIVKQVEDQAPICYRDGDGRCAFCHEEDLDPHKPDCPVLLSQKMLNKIKDLHGIE